jgi:hypothetical protein
MDTKVCNRCKRLGRPSEHPLSDFYMRGKKALPTCKVCRRELSKEHHKRVMAEENETQAKDPLTGSRVFPGDVFTRTVVSQAGPGMPHIAVWRCMSCYRKAITRGRSREIAPGIPKDWRNLSLRMHSHEEPVILCGPCSTALLRARQILARIAERLEQEHNATH